MALNTLTDEAIFARLKLRGGKKQLSDGLKHKLRESGALSEFRLTCEEYGLEEAVFDLESKANTLLRSRSSKDSQDKSVATPGHRKYVAYMQAITDFVETEAKQMPCVVDFQRRVIRHLMGKEKMWRVLTNPGNQFLSIEEIKELGAGIYQEQELLLERTVRVKVNQQEYREVMTVILQIDKLQIDKTTAPHRLKKRVKCDPKSMIELATQPLIFTGRNQVSLSNEGRDWPETAFRQGVSVAQPRPIRGLPGSVVGEALKAAEELCRQHHFDPLQALVLLFTGRYQPPLSLQTRTRIYGASSGGFIRLDVPFFAPPDRVAEDFQRAVQIALGKRFRHIDDHSIDLFEFVNREKGSLDADGRRPSWDVLHARWRRWCDEQKQTPAAEPSTQQESLQSLARQPETNNERETFKSPDNFRFRYQQIKKTIMPLFQK